MKYIYGPVPSWRLGRSLGVDLISTEKVCSFDCIYCQLGETATKTTEREQFVPTDDVISELEQVLPKCKADIITFSGRGEPTLASNLREVAEAIKGITDLETAILTNSSLIWQKDVQKDLGKIDFVVAKLDAHNEDLFKRINKPAEGITLEKIISGIKEFKSNYNGKLALQIMFMGLNKPYARELAEISREIGPDEVQLDTPLRPCGVKPLGREEMEKIEKEFHGLNTKSVYIMEKPDVDIIDMEKTLERRPEI